MDDNTVHNCCICGVTFRGYGNNPAPVKEYGRACDHCNTTEVVPTRFKQLQALGPVVMRHPPNTTGEPR
jgi:hypothetical protein